METLSPNEVHLWTLATDEAHGGRATSDCQLLLSPDEIHRAERFVFEKDRRQFTVSHALVRTALSNFCDVDPADWMFAVNDFGKPEVAGAEAALNLTFNLTHTNGLVACAVCLGRDVGVDAESITRDVEPDIARKFFSSGEVEYLRTVGSGQAWADAFFDLWTLKESYIKARGMGLSIPLDEFEIHPGIRNDARISFAHTIEDDPSDWQFFRIRPSPWHRLAMCIHRPAGPDCEIVKRSMVLTDAGLKAAKIDPEMPEAEARD